MINCPFCKIACPDDHRTEPPHEVLRRFIDSLNPDLWPKTIYYGRNLADLMEHRLKASREAS
jgi:hypothetical protein